MRAAIAVLLTTGIGILPPNNGQCAPVQEQKLCKELEELAPKGRALGDVREELARRSIDASYSDHKDLDRVGDDAKLRKDFRSVLIVAAAPPKGVLVSYNELVIIGFDQAQTVKEVRCRHYGFGP